jgi:hemolysin-activating ACP:hemolysin acyltransferase
MALIVSQMNRPDAALAAAAHFLARRAPFDQFGFGMMTLSLDAQVKNRTYLFAIDGVKVVGYLGWAMLDTARAEAFARENRVPRHDETGGDDVIWLLVAAAASKTALDAMLEAGRKRYAGKRIMGVRHKPGGRVVKFDKLIRLRNK